MFHCACLRAHTGPGQPFKIQSDTYSDTDTASEAGELESEDNLSLIFWVASALQLATELGEPYGFLVIDLANLRNSLSALDDSVLAQIVEEAVSLNKETVKLDASMLSDGKNFDQLMSTKPEEWFEERVPVISGIQ